VVPKPDRLQSPGLFIWHQCNNYWCSDRCQTRYSGALARARASESQMRSYCTYMTGEAVAVNFCLMSLGTATALICLSHTDRRTVESRFLSEFRWQVSRWGIQILLQAGTIISWPFCQGKKHPSTSSSETAFVASHYSLYEWKKTSWELTTTTKPMIIGGLSQRNSTKCRINLAQSLHPPLYCKYVQGNSRRFSVESLRARHAACTSVVVHRYLQVFATPSPTQFIPHVCLNLQKRSAQQIMYKIAVWVTVTLQIYMCRSALLFTNVTPWFCFDVVQ
jgi:hypothetical protein